MSKKILSAVNNAPGVLARCLADKDVKRNCSDDGVMRSPSTKERPFTARVWRKFSIATILGTLSVLYSIDGNGFGLIFLSPKWLAHAAYEVEWRGAHFGPTQITLRLYNTRPNDSLIFKCLKMGDFLGMLHLFSNHQASPFDRDEDGQSLLHVSIRSPNTQRRGYFP